MDRILEIDRDNLCVVTQPGVINAELKAAVASEGLFYPPDPASYEIVLHRRQPRARTRAACAA